MIEDTDAADTKDTSSNRDALATAATADNPTTTESTEPDRNATGANEIKHVAPAKPR